MILNNMSQSQLLADIEINSNHDFLYHKNVRFLKLNGNESRLLKNNDLLTKDCSVKINLFKVLKN